jgi:hypothetical protein
MNTCKSANEVRVIDQLQTLVEFERQVREVTIEDIPEVHLANDGTRLTLSSGGVDLHGAIDRPLVHQIGGRIWPEASEYRDVAARWHSSFKNGKSQLESDIAAAFARHNLKVRYVARGGSNQIYGVVTPHFVEVNQLEFRQAFLEEARQSTTLVAKTKRVELTSFGNVVEFFDFDSPGFQVELEYGLVYARNTGYDAYKVDWGRWVLVCSNGLRRREAGERFTWRHTHSVDLREFLNATVAEGVGNQRYLEKRIHSARETAVSRDALGELLGRLSLAESTKQRLAARVVDESRTVGANEWALSQAFTYLGTHDRHISFRTKRQFTEFGTDVLEHSLDEVLNDESEVGKDGFYGLLLPSPLRYH